MLRYSCFLFNLSCQSHADGSGCCGGRDVGCVYLLLVTLDVELKGGPVIAHVDGDVSAHHDGQVHVAMTAREAAEHRNMIFCQQLVEHRLDALVSELLATVGELTEDDALASVEYAIHLEDAHLAVDVVHRLLDFLNEKNEVLALGGIRLCAEVGCEGAEVAAYECAAGLARDVLLVCR